MLNMTAPTWTPSSGSMAAEPPKQQQNELQFLKDREYGFHGKIMMVSMISIFFVFIIFLAIFPCLKLATNTESRCSNFVKRPKNTEDATTAVEDSLHQKQ